MKQDRYSGACLCGAVRYEIFGELSEVANCHCATCRRHSGAAFLTYAACKAADLRFTAEQPHRYRSSEAAERGHCKVCGSPLTLVYDATPDIVWLTLGSFDQPERVVPREHWFAASKLPWLHLDDGLPHWEGFPP